MGRARTKNYGLPTGMVVRSRPSGTYYYFRHPTTREEVPLGKDKSKALEHYKALAGEDAISSPTYFDEGFAAVMFKNMAKNARARGIPVEITEADVQRMLVRAEFRCEITGIRFDLRPIPGQRIRLWAPSIDRIDATKPYTIDNCRVITAAMNVALNQFGDEVFYSLAFAAVIHSRERPSTFLGKSSNFREQKKKARPT